MKKDIRISPIGLKGNEINERMRQLMGIQSINENKSNIVIELTKMGPDGNAYAIVRENHEWYIKKANKSKGLIAEDFKYIGGLMNKKDEAYSSYAKAIKHLNFKFKSLAEAYNFEGEINVFENDNLLSEGVGGYYEMKGNGFTGAGNMEENTPMWESDEIEMSEAEMAIDDMKNRNNVDTDDLENNTSNDAAYSKAFDLMNEGVPMETVNWALATLMSAGMFASVWAIFKSKELLERLATREDEVGKAADTVLSFFDGLSNSLKEGGELKGDQYKLDKDKNGILNKKDFEMMGNMNESRFSIDDSIDKLIQNLNEGLKKKV